MMNSKKYACIHGHFYQPPRENAWLEVIELQDSAAPFHDWNERINFECYATNAAARILDHEQNIINIVNNYSKISFNFGPTLLSWMEKADPDTYQAILKADQLSMERFNGHGAAIAQVHSHLILPLANRRDKETQVIWGIRDFEYRFKRKPEGIWLAETATDTETLEVLAENGIQYTIVAPRQAKAIRKIGTEDWEYVSAETVESRRAYVQKLPSGKSINIFVYHGGLAQGVAFDGLLNNGSHFANSIMNCFDDNDHPQLVHIATDGESYGHHHNFGEMALASCLDQIDQSDYAAITNYGAYLELFPPEYEIELHENSSWSCVHGVERWRSNCGCNSGGHPNWTQAWRKPLRESLDWIRDQLIPVYESEGALLLKDVWEARNDYINVLVNRNHKTMQEFIARNAKKELNEEEEIHLFRLMEMQRNTILMYTSCGWFFDEISGIETNQILQYANRAIQYMARITGTDLHAEFIQRLEEAPSNVFENGAVSYKENVVPARVDLTRVGMHYAVASLFDAFPRQPDFFNYFSENEVFERYEAGTQRLAIGRTTVISKITRSRKHFSFAALYLGQQNIIGNISIDMDRETFDKMLKEISTSFIGTNLGEVIGYMQQYFGSDKYSIWHLFRDEKRKILKQITDKSLQQVAGSFRDIYNDNYQLMLGIAKSNIPIPEAYQSAVNFVVNQDFRNLFDGKLFNIREFERLTSEISRWNVKLTDQLSLGYIVSERLFKEVKKLERGSMSLEYLQELTRVLEKMQHIGIQLNLWKSQNMYFYMLKGLKDGKWVFASSAWSEAFEKLGNLLGVKVN